MLTFLLTGIKNISGYFSGHDYASSKNFPTKVQAIESVGLVACGGSHTLAVSLDGKTIWSFGGGENGHFFIIKRPQFHNII